MNFNYILIFILQLTVLIFASKTFEVGFFTNLSWAWVFSPLLILLCGLGSLMLIAFFIQFINNKNK